MHLPVQLAYYYSVSLLKLE